ncbi:unnamed protein product, partial [Mesorhabditis spiculigera]
MHPRKQHLFNYQGYIGAYLLIGGVDPTGPHLYECTANTSTMHKEFAAQGSVAMPLSRFSNDFKPKMTEAEAKDLVQRALHAGMHGDNAKARFSQAKVFRDLQEKINVQGSLCQQLEDDQNAREAALRKLTTDEIEAKEMLEQVLGKREAEKSADDSLRRGISDDCEYLVESTSEMAVKQIAAMEKQLSAREHGCLVDVRDDGVNVVGLHPGLQQLTHISHYDENGDEIMDLPDRESVSTAFGKVKVTIYGDRARLPLVTFHDLGLDSESNFQNFFQFVSIAEFTDKFCIYNINAPGQEMDAKPLPENFQYPTMEGLANIVENVVEHFKLPHFFAFGVGLGANVLLRYTLMNQDRVNALILVNCVHSTCGWVEWGYEKVNQRHLKNYGMTSFVADYLMWHHFGRRIDECSSDIVRQYRVYFQHLPNPTNLSMLIDAYINRTPINFSREGGAAGPQLKVPVLQLVGASSAFVNETVEVNTRLDPSRSDWIKVSGSCGLVLDDRPEAVTEALMLFLQGLGYFPTMNVVKLMKQIHEAQSGSYAAEQRCVDEC